MEKKKTTQARKKVLGIMLSAVMLICVIVMLIVFVNNRSPWDASLLDMDRTVFSQEEGEQIFYECREELEYIVAFLKELRPVYEGVYSISVTTSPKPGIVFYSPFAPWENYPYVEVDYGRDKRFEECIQKVLFDKNMWCIDVNGTSFLFGPDERIQYSESLEEMMRVFQGPFYVKHLSGNWYLSTSGTEQK